MQVYTTGNEVKFKPPPDFVGIVYIGYSIADGQGGTDSATIRLEYRVCKTESIKAHTTSGLATSYEAGRPESITEHTIKWCTNGDSATVVKSTLSAKLTFYKKALNFTAAQAEAFLILRGYIGVAFVTHGHNGKVGGSTIKASSSVETCFSPGAKIGTKAASKLYPAVAVFLKTGLKKKVVVGLAEHVVDTLVLGQLKILCLDTGGWNPKFSWSFKNTGAFKARWVADRDGHGAVHIRFRKQKGLATPFHESFTHKCRPAGTPQRPKTPWYAEECTTPNRYW